MQKQNILFIAVIGLAILSIFSLAITYKPNLDHDTSETFLKYKANVCVYKNGELVQCDHNVLYNFGKNMTRDLLGYGGVITGNISTIALCNASSACSVPVASGADSFRSYDNCGLTNATGAYVALNSYDGNWTITKTFTATCDGLTTNVTRLQNASGGIFAGNSFSLVTLQTSDQLTVNWSISIS